MPVQNTHQSLLTEIDAGNRKFMHLSCRTSISPGPYGNCTASTCRHCCTIGYSGESRGGSMGSDKSPFLISYLVLSLCKNPGFIGSYRCLREIRKIAMILSDFTWLLPWVNHGEILCDFCHDLIMGGFYVTCKVFPMFTFVHFIWEDFT